MGMSGGAAYSLISTVISTAGSMMANQSGNAPSGNDSASREAELKAEREKQESEQKQREADERKRERDKVLDAREQQRKRAATKSTSTTLVNGGAGLLTEPKVEKTGLKEKFGE